MRVAAIIYFEDNTTAQEVKVLLEDVKAKQEEGTGPHIEHAIVNSYDPEYGHPVWYIP